MSSVILRVLISLCSTDMKWIKVGASAHMFILTGLHLVRERHTFGPNLPALSKHSQIKGILKTQYLPHLMQMHLINSDTKESTYSLRKTPFILSPLVGVMLGHPKW